MSGQHFLMSERARDLPMAKIARLSEYDARRLVRDIRWPNGPVCDVCGGAVYEYRSRVIFKCPTCKEQFSLTSSTYLASRKMPLRDCLLAAALFVNAAKGHPALRASRDIGINYRTALRIFTLFREIIHQEQENIQLSGTVQVDGAFFGGYFKVENKVREGRVKRLVRGHFVNRQVVIVAREGTNKTITTVAKKESEAVDWIARRVAAGTIIQADGAHAWDRLSGLFETLRINHNQAYCIEGAHTNYAESFFSRLRKVAVTHGHITSKNLPLYAAECAWREDRRRVGNSGQFRELISLLMKNPAVCGGSPAGSFGRESSRYDIVTNVPGQEFDVPPTVVRSR